MGEPQAVDLYALSDLCTPWCLHVVATLRIAEHIEAGKGDINDLAMAAGCDADVLRGVLEHLIGKGVFAQLAPGRFALNDAARGLLDPAVRIGLDLDGIGGRMAHAWGGLMTFVRTGKPGYADIFGRTFWEDLDSNPDVAASFDSLIGLIGHGWPNADFKITGGWDAVRSVVDVGGGTGAMLAEILRRHPALHGTLVEVPRAVKNAVPLLKEARVADRVTLCAQSFFEPLPAGADLYLLRGVLNNWPDQEATSLLRGCADAMGADGRVVILKSVGPDGAPAGMPIDRLLTGGKHRSISELRVLASRAGLDVVAAGQQPDYFVVECRRSA